MKTLTDFDEYFPFQLSGYFPEDDFGSCRVFATRTFFEEIEDFRFRFRHRGQHLVEKIILSVQRQSLRARGRGAFEVVGMYVT